jgi:hypothetical protein
MTSDNDTTRLGLLTSDYDPKDAELETLRVQLAACGVAAMANTPATVAQRLSRDSPYWTASYGDVCRAVDKQIELRDRQDETVRTFLGWLSGDIPELHSVEVPRLAESWERFQVAQIIDKAAQS